MRRLVAQGANVLAVVGSKTKQALLTDICGSGVPETIIGDVNDAKQVLAYAMRAAFA